MKNPIISCFYIKSFQITANPALISISYKKSSQIDIDLIFKIFIRDNFFILNPDDWFIYLLFDTNITIPDHWKAEDKHQTKIGIPRTMSRFLISKKSYGCTVLQRQVGYESEMAQSCLDKWQGCSIKASALLILWHSSPDGTCHSVAARFTSQTTMKFLVSAYIHHTFLLSSTLIHPRSSFSQNFGSIPRNLILSLLKLPVTVIPMLKDFPAIVCCERRLLIGSVDMSATDLWHLNVCILKFLHLITVLSVIVSTIGTSTRTFGFGIFIEQDAGIRYFCN